MENIISIIIPTYNGEKNIGKCIESITLYNSAPFEIIVIDDGSTDETLNIVKRYEKQYENVRVVPQKNQGVSAARNSGIQQSKGKYIVFVDCDDYLYEGAIDKLYSLINESELDLILYGYKRNTKSEDINTLRFLSKCTGNLKQEILKALFSVKDNWLFGSCWRAVYNKNIIQGHNIKFPSGVTFAEDSIFLFNYLNHSNSIKILPQELYEYYHNENSTTLKYIPNLVNDIQYIDKWLKDNIFKENQELIDYYSSYYIDHFYFIYINSMFRQTNKTFFQIHRQIKKDLKKCKFKYHIDRVWKEKNTFNGNTTTILTLCHFHLQWIYEIRCYFKVKKRN